MTYDALALLAALAADLLALVSLVVSLLGRSGNVRQLTLDVAELYDRVDHWQRRDRVRKLREGQEKAAAAERELPAAGARITKEMLRDIAFGGRHGE